VKRIFGAIIILFTLALIIAGCDTSSHTAATEVTTEKKTTENSSLKGLIEKQEQKAVDRKQKEILEFVQDCNDEVSEYRDKDTGVHYFILFQNNGANGTGGAMCPRYNADGSLYVD